MREDDLDAMVAAALLTEPGKLFHAWLNNNWLMTPRVTVDPHEALFAQAQACLVASLNTRLARNLNATRSQQQPTRTSPGIVERVFGEDTP